MKKLLSLVIVIMLACLQVADAQCIKGNCHQGRGTYIYQSGAKYAGQFRKGKIHGQGVLYFSNGNKYVGEWKNQYREGKGKMTFTNGDTYVGNFKKSKFYGHGIMDFAKGDKYDGQWRDDIQHGLGTYYYKDGDRYEGGFKKGKLDGKGTMFYSNGSKYVGNWKSNRKDGNGVFHKKDGKKIAGVWLAGKYIGNDNKPSQQNSSNNSNVEYASNTNDVTTEKELKDCNKIYCRGGQGFYTYNDGSKFVGSFKDGYPEGEGTVFYANGDKYVGGWKNHAPHNEGIMYYKHGRVLGAIWQYGKPIKTLEADDADVGNEYIAVDRDDDVKIWAVVVGVARYGHMPVLKYTDDDAYHVYAFLKSPEGGALPDDQIKVLIDEDATRTNIMRTMRQTFLKADENDVVVLYFSGHGLQGSFLPVDFDGFNNKLKHEDIKDILNESKARHKLLLADACHSGSLMAMRSAPVQSTLKKYYNAFEESTGGMALLMSSKGEEFSLEDGGLRQGIFSHYLIRGLKGEADEDRNKIVTVQELFDYVYTQVRRYTAHAQTPTLTGIFDDTMPVSVVRH